METDVRLRTDLDRLDAVEFARRYQCAFLAITIEPEGVESDEFVEYNTIVDARNDSPGGSGTHLLAAVVKRPGANEFSFVTIGRATNNDIVLDMKAVSKCHAVITQRGDEYTIADARSKNGTKLNGRGLEPNEPARFDVGDTITLSPQISAMLLDAQGAHRWFRLVAG